MFSITANVTNTTSNPVLSLPFVQVVGISHNTSGGDVFGSATGTGVVINDSLVPTSSMTGTFSVDQAIQWRTVVQVDKAVLYPSFFGPPPCDQNSQGNQNQAQNGQGCHNP